MDAEHHPINEACAAAMRERLVRRASMALTRPGARTEMRLLYPNEYEREVASEAIRRDARFIVHDSRPVVVERAAEGGANRKSQMGKAGHSEGRDGVGAERGVEPSPCPLPPPDSAGEEAGPQDSGPRTEDSAQGTTLPGVGS